MSARGQTPFTLISLLRATACDPITEDACEEELVDELETLSGGVAAADILLCAQKDYTVSNLRLAIQLARVDMGRANNLDDVAEDGVSPEVDRRPSVPGSVPPTEPKVLM